MADLYTAEAVMDFWDKHSTDDAKDERYRIEQIKKDRDTARKYLKDAISRYRKDKTRSRSKAKAENPFSDLEQYSSREDIRDSFGWELISEKEMDRLLKLWDLREESKNKATLEDRVTEMLEQAFRSCGSQYDEEIMSYEEKRAKQWHEAERIARENLMRS